MNSFAMLITLFERRKEKKKEKKIFFLPFLLSSPPTHSSTMADADMQQFDLMTLPFAQLQQVKKQMEEVKNKEEKKRKIILIEKDLKI